MNLRRRNLTQSQKAMVATESLPLFEAEAKERQREAGQSHGRGKVPEIIPGAITIATEGQIVDGNFRKIAKEQGDARDKAAAAVGVNPRYVSDAKAISKAAPEIAEK